MEEKFMHAAIALALEAAAEDEVPVGCVVVNHGEIVGRGRNRRELAQNALAHAEIEAINEACKTIGSWRLWEAELYVTLEPCPMCAGAIINARIPKVFFGAYDPKGGAAGTILDLFEYPFNHKPEVEGGILETECGRLLTEFFKGLRERGK